MNRRLLSLALVGLLLTLGLGSVFAAPPPNPVKASLVANVSTAAPGSTFMLGVRLQAEAGWHVYWLHPGESGLPTQVTLKLPAGFEAGDPRWPIPVPFQQDNIRCNGYEGEVMPIFPIKVAANATGTLAIKADVTWLACKGLCKPGRASLDLSLPVGPKAVPANEKLFLAWEFQMPLAADAEMPFTFTNTVGAGNKVEATLAWKVAPKKVDWFPNPSDTLELSAAEVKQDKNQTKITFTAAAVAGQQESAKALPALVVWTDAAGRRKGAWVSIKLR